MTRPNRDMSEDGCDPARPVWLDEACPTWCTRDHREGDHPEDRYHQSEPSMVPLIASAGTTIDVVESLEAIDMLVLLGCHVGDTCVWLAVEPADRPAPRIVMTAESARSLVHSINDQLQRLSSG